MSEARSFDSKKEAQLESGGSYGEECQCDSGIGGIRSLPGHLEEGEPRSPAARGVPSDEGSEPPRIGKEGAEPTLEVDERLDSSYGSSSLVESLPRLEEPPGAGEEDDDDKIRQQLLETFTFISEDGDTLEERNEVSYLQRGQFTLWDLLTSEKQLDSKLQWKPRLSKDAASCTCVGCRWRMHIGPFVMPVVWHRLLHLAIIHCMPALALSCIAQSPVEVLELQNDLFQTPLHLSVYLEQHSVVEALVLQGVKTALQDRNGNTPLHLACEQQSLECAQLLLQEPVPGKSLGARRTQQDLQLQNWQGLTCLHISTLKGNLQLMALLVKNGADINIQDGTSGKTSLHLAVENHDEMAVRLLLRMGAQVDAQMYNGCTSLHLAVGRKDAVIAAILCHSGADTLLRNMEDETAQDLADGNDDILTVLPFDDLKISGKPVVCSS
ncbi:hypothetical protein lerEdw1_006300 [Lerista edwardsae]|nr:hypothetical protein lerEdw1_006300 [Lerista edwardsae]